MFAQSAFVMKWLVSPTSEPKVVGSNSGRTFKYLTYYTFLYSKKI